MVGFQHLRAANPQPLVAFADQARKMATELEQFSSDTDAQKRQLTGVWSGADASAAMNSLAGHSNDFRNASARYGRVDAIVGNLANQINSAKQALESAIGMVPSIPGSINEAGTITINYAALGANPSPAAVAAAEARARQVHGYIMQAIQAATQADQTAASELAELAIQVSEQTGTGDGQNGQTGDGEQPAQTPDGQQQGQDGQGQDGQGQDGQGQDGQGQDGQGQDGQQGGQDGQQGGEDGQNDQDGDGEGEGDNTGDGNALNPVGPWNQAQMNNAQAIIDAGRERGISERGQAIALATAMQESTLRNLANSGMPESLALPNEGTGRDHDSVGLFQQRTSQGWGTVPELMDPTTSANRFYDALERVNNWENRELTDAAQRVQRSAFPDAYAQWEDEAYEILREYNRANGQ